MKFLIGWMRLLVGIGLIGWVVSLGMIGIVVVQHGITVLPLYFYLGLLAVTAILVLLSRRLKGFFTEK